MANFGREPKPIGHSGQLISAAIRKLAIVGGSVRAAAFSAIRAGFEAATADVFADADLARVADATRLEDYPEALPEWLAGVECDAWMYTGAMENHPGLVGRMAAVRPLLGNDPAALERIRDPLAVQRILRDAGLSFPETLKSGEELPLDDSWVCKTYDTAGGAGVWGLDSQEALERAKREGALYQRRVAGAGASAVFVVYESEAVFLGATRQLVGFEASHARRWQYSGSIGPADLSSSVAKQLTTLGGLLVHKFHLRGVIGVDLMIMDDRAYVIEVNPRYSASTEIVEEMTAAQAIAEHMAACTGEKPATAGRTAVMPTSTQEQAKALAKAILFAAQDVTIACTFHDWALKRAGVDFNQRELADVPNAGEEIAAGKPVLTVFASGPKSDCEHVLAERVAEVERRLYANA